MGIDVSEPLLGTIDCHDCMLTLGGDPAVNADYRRNIFGLFQESRPKYPLDIQSRASKYAHIRETLHGVLFLFRRRDSGLLTYQLEHYLICNPHLLDLNKARAIHADLIRALPVRQAE